MRATEPLPLHHSWALDAAPVDWDDRSSGTAARWHCDLSDNTLHWDAGVFDLFGLPQDISLTRELAVACYAEPSRAAMERLRAHAIRFRRGFTIDVEVGPPAMQRRWVRLIAAPVLTANRVVALTGVKLPLSP